MKDLVKKIFEQQGITIVICLILVAIVVFQGRTVEIGKDTFVIGDKTDIQSITNRLDGISETILEVREMAARSDKFTVNEMVRMVDKQYQKIMEKPDDLYASDLQYIVEIIWPDIPDDRKTVTLKEYYGIIEKKYTDELKS